jgi:RimJ/RimL family protein N-acetyltransferase
MIRGKKVNLRTVNEADLDTVAAYMNDIQLRGEYESIDLGTEVEMRAKFAQTGFWESEEGVLNITDKQDQLLGFVRYWKPFTSPHRLAYEVSFAIDKPTDWGKGFMSEALSLFVAFLFATKMTERIQATVHPDNTASRRVLEKTGFKLEGILRKAYIWRGIPTDVQLFSIIRAECSPLVM